MAADERETTDLRALLNLGHTFGHALEAETGFGSALLHGEAVGTGMAMAFDLSARLGLCPEADAERVRRHLGAVGLPVRLRTIGGDNSRIWSAAQADRAYARRQEGRGGKLTFVLARGIGKSFVTRDVDEAACAACSTTPSLLKERHGSRAAFRYPAFHRGSSRSSSACFWRHYLSAAETAITGASRPRMHRLAQQGNPKPPSS